MYPTIRLAKEMLRYRRAPKLRLGETHSTTLVCWPWDIDVWMELNNGRALTLGDLARIVMFSRLGVTGTMRRRGWGGTVAGSSVRYRRRVRVFDRIEVRARVIGWDERFTYVEQSMWRKDECTSHALLRTAITGPSGIVPSAEAAEAFGFPELELPDWALAWARAEAQRPWPPAP